MPIRNGSVTGRDTASPQGFESRYLVLGFLCLSAAIAYVQRAALSVPATEVAGNLNFDDLAGRMGMIQSAWYFWYGLMQLPAGRLIDRFGARNALAALSVAWSTATCLSGFATDFTSLLFFWSLMGAAQAGAFPAAAKAMGQLFPESERARATGLLASGMTIGGALAPALTAKGLEWLTPWADSLGVDRWRLLLAAYAIPGVLWSIAFLIILPARKMPVVNRSGEKRQGISWKALLRNRPLALLCAQQFFRAAAMVFFLTWFPTFLQKTRGVSLTESGILTTVAGLGSVVGSMTGGFFSDWLLKRTGNARLSRQGIAVAGMGSCSLLIMASYFAADVKVSIGLIALGAFCASFGGVSGYTVAISYGGAHVATVFGTMNMCGNFGAALFPITAAWLVSATGNWNLMLFLFAGIMAVDAVCWALLNPKGTFSGDDDASDPNA